MKLIRYLLLPFSWLYGIIIILRNLCYDIGVFPILNVNVPVVSVGNLTAGGTGKTPFVEYLIRYFLMQNRKIVVVSRGYKRATRGTKVVSDGNIIDGNADTVGDEPFQIAKKFPEVIVMVDEKRSRAARLAVQRFNPAVILLDDSFQHRRIKRNLDIVMIDGNKSLKNIPMLPAGLRREPISSLKRADVIIVSNIENSTKDRLNKLTGYDDIPVGYIKYKPVRLVECFTRVEIPISTLSQNKCVAFCGIGNPESFKATLSEIGANIRYIWYYPDHYKYKTVDIGKIKELYMQHQAEFIVTTEKDAARMSSIELTNEFPKDVLYFIEIEAIMTEGEEMLNSFLNRTIHRAA